MAIDNKGKMYTYIVPSGTIHLTGEGARKVDMLYVSASTPTDSAYFKGQNFGNRTSAYVALPSSVPYETPEDTNGYPPISINNSDSSGVVYVVEYY